MSNTQTNNHYEFQGFGSPNFTQVPDEAIDQLMPRLSGAEFKVLLYIIRRTYGFKKSADDISLKQMVEGIKTREGKQLDSGTGLTKETVTLAVKHLVEQRVITARRNQSERRGDEATTYQLQFQVPVSENPTPRVGKSDPQETVRQKTASFGGLLAQEALASPHASPSKFRNATHEEFSEKTSQGTGNPEQRTPHRSGFVPLGSVLPTSSVIPTGERRADQATRHAQTDKPAAASHPTGEEDRQLTSQAQPTAPDKEQSSQVPDLTHEPKRRQNRILARQVSQPEPPSQSPAPPTSSAEQENQARAPQKPVTTDTTAAETEALSGISARQNTSAAPARRRAARPAPQPAPDLAQEQAAEERAVVLAYIRDYAAEFHDQASLKSSVTRAHRLFTDSGLPMEQWVSKLYEAHRITRERSAAIGYQGQGKKRSSETSSGLTNKMPYFFELLTCVLGLHDHPAGQHPLPMTQQEFRRQQGRAGSQRVAPTPASAEQKRQAPEAVAVVRTPLPRETEAHTLWQAVLEDLAQTITRPMFETYLAGTQGVAVENGQLVVSVPSDFTADWLSRKLTPLIRQNIEKLTGIAASVSFRVEQTPDTHPLASRLQQETQYALRGYSP